MPLKLATERRYTWPVIVSRPNDGDWEEFQFNAHFVAPSRDELKAVYAGEIPEDDFLRQHLTGWDGLQDGDGQPLEFNPDNLTAALNDTGVYRAIIKGLMESAAGAAERKNSKPPRA